MGKHKAYPEYKGSGVEWIGQVPNHWDIHSLKRTVKGCVNGIWGSEPDGESDLIVLRVADFDRVKLDIRDDKLTYRSIPAKDRKSRLLKSGDLLIEKSGGGEKTLVGCVVRFDKDYPAVTSNFVAKMSPLTGYDSAFLNYAFAHLYSGRVNYPAIKQTTGIQNLDSDAYLMERFAFPSSEEQRTIAAFLDYETARIDSLIDKQQRLIELLKEKRQAVISHAVTKGLNPDAPMKDSGVEWLGQVPEHWVVGPLKYRITSMDQGWSPQCEARLAEEGEFGVLKVGAVNGGIFKPMEHKALPSELEPKLRYRVTKGVLLISRANTRELVGSAAVVNDDYDNLLVCDKLYRLTLNQDTDAEFVALVLGVPAYREQIELSATGASDSMQNIGQGTIRELIIAMPSKQEAKVIVESVVLISEKYSRLIESACKQIVLLNERRTALISAAVTGKIDLREWVKPT
ncbi:restriction endonuclease subunit S [Shewanella indica]|uniref:restriction endonuclease subunit S n=1 Tax=Shewanella indica TaxID=768528 RepID=UPI000C34F5B3|nr:restriction endonuclease subunit S [Shewanella indica]GHA98835.1 type I restriction endonuclease subunit S [Shewanella indica]